MNTKHINKLGLIDLEVENQLLKKIKTYKQGDILNNSLYSANYKINKEFKLHIPEKDFNYIVTNEIAKSVTNALMPSLKNNIEKKEDDLTEEYIIEFFAIKPEDLKHIVEYCIKTIPEEVLNKIRN